MIMRTYVGLTKRTVQLGLTDGSALLLMLVSLQSCVWCKQLAAYSACLIPCDTMQYLVVTCDTMCDTMCETM